MIIIRICTFYSPLKIFLPISIRPFLDRLGVLLLYVHDLRPVYQHECTSSDHLDFDIHAGLDFRADLPDAI